MCSRFLTIIKRRGRDVIGNRGLRLYGARKMPSALIDENQSAARLLDLQPATFAKAFNREPFLLRHNLVGNPLLQLDRLVELALRLGSTPGEGYFDVAVDRVDQRWDQTPRPPVTVEEVIKNIGESKAWI